MKRCVVLILLLLVAGAIVNVAVAWGVANFHAKPMTGHATMADGTSTVWTTLIAPAVQGWPAASLTYRLSGPPSDSPITIRHFELAPHPIWLGFAINTVFYAGVLWLLFAGPFALRRRRHIKRGLCPKCAYPVGKNAVCTECGVGLLDEIPTRSAPAAFRVSQ